MIDEFPVLMVAALCAGGETIVRDAKELRVKETDRHRCYGSRTTQNECQRLKSTGRRF